MAGIALGGAPRALAYAAFGAGIGTGSLIALGVGGAAIAALGALGLVVGWRLRSRGAGAA